MKESPLISVQNISKKYCRNLKNSLWYGVEDIVNELIMRRSEKRIGHLRRDEFWALQNISFELRRGESLAIIGANGAGKSTLLKLLYGLIKPHSGEVHIHGSVGAMIELGVGFDPVLSGRENIYIRTALSGVSRKQTESLILNIINFSGLEDFIDSPIQFYSTGMLSRLTYAVNRYLRTDILLVDEILAVGDMDFQRKCITDMLKYLSDGGSLVFVSHNAYQIQSVCKRGILLEEGKIAFAGSAKETLEFYIERQNNKLKTTLTSSKEKSLSEDAPVVIEKIELESLNGNEIEQGGSVLLRLSYQSLKDIEDVLWGFTIWNYNNLICITGSYNSNHVKIYQGKGELSCVIPNLPLLGGKYLLKAGLAEKSVFYGLSGYGWENMPFEFVVKSKPGSFNTVQSAMNQLVDINVEWE